MQTKQAVTIAFRNYGNITIPQGTRLTHKTAMGIDKAYHFVDDLSFIEVFGNKHFVFRAYTNRILKTEVETGTKTLFNL